MPTGLAASYNGQCTSGWTRFSREGVAEMAKGSRKRATKYSELSKEGKKRQQAKPVPRYRSVSVPVAQERPEPVEAAREAKPQKVVPKAHSLHSPMSLDYSHVRGDLRRTGVLAGAFVVLLIILSFVLG